MLYFEYVDIPDENNTSSQNFKRCLELRDKLKKVELPLEFKTNSIFTDFSRDIIFRERFENISEEIKRTKKENLEWWLKAYSRVKTLESNLNHGDLFHGNFTQTLVFDWDRVGYYPYGYDFGMLIAFYKLKEQDKLVRPQDIMAQIDDLEIIKKEYILSVYFFTTIFLFNRDKTINNCNFIELTGYLKNLL